MFFTPLLSVCGYFSLAILILLCVLSSLHFVLRLRSESIYIF